MAPGSQGAGAVFVCFSGEDSGRTGDAIGEPRVARRSRSRNLSNVPWEAGQLPVSRKESAREAAVRKKNASNLRPIFPWFLSMFARVFDLTPNVGF